MNKCPLTKYWLYTFAWDFLVRKTFLSLLNKRRNCSSDKQIDLPMSEQEFEEEAKVAKYSVQCSSYYAI